MRNKPVRDLATGLILMNGKVIQRTASSKLGAGLSQEYDNILIEPEATAQTVRSRNETVQWAGQTGPVIPEHTGPTETQPNGYLNGQIWNKEVPTDDKPLTEPIVPFLYCTPVGAENTFTRLLPEGGTVEVDLSHQRCWAVTRDHSKHAAMGVFFVEVKINGYITQHIDQGDIQFTTITETGLTDGGCPNNPSYGVPFSYTRDTIEGDPTYIFATPDVEYIEHVLPLAPGDTHVLYRETISHGDHKTLLQWDSFRTKVSIGGGGHLWDFFDAYYLGRPGISSVLDPYAIGGNIVPAPYSWSLTSHPSGAYEISGSGTKFAIGFDFNIIQRERNPNQAGNGDLGESLWPFCEGGDPIWSAAEVDLDESSGPTSVTSEALIPVGVVKHTESYVSSSEEFDFFLVSAEQTAIRTTENEYLVDYGLPPLVRTLAIPDSFKVTELSQSPVYLFLGHKFAREADAVPDSKDTGFATPTLIIPSGELKAYTVYERDLTTDPIEQTYRFVRPDDQFQINETQKDPAFPAQLDPVVWPSPCHENYLEQKGGNLNKTRKLGFTAQLFDIDLALNSDEPTEISFQEFSITDDGEICTSTGGSSLTVPFVASGLTDVTAIDFELTVTEAGAFDLMDVETIAAGPNKVAKKFGRKSVV